MSKVKHSVPLFDANKGETQEQRDRMVAFERLVKEDGYDIWYADGDGLFTFATFTNDEDYIMFKLKYSEWMV